jgi:hypothetical protein
VGACTANAKTGQLGSDPFFATLSSSLVLDEAFALKLYSLEEIALGYGPYPPNDQGGTGQAISQVSKKDGYESGYQHALNVTDMSAAIMNTPVIIGINWYSSFDTPNSSGLISLPSSAYVRGGHEVLVRGVDPDASIFYADNSWGSSWGVKGSFQIPFAIMDRLLSEGGDCTVSVPLSSPAPTPAPVTSYATAADQVLNLVAGPWAEKPRVRTDLVDLKNAIIEWKHASGL